MHTKSIVSAFVIILLALIALELVVLNKPRQSGNVIPVSPKVFGTSEDSHAWLHTAEPSPSKSSWDILQNNKQAISNKNPIILTELAEAYLREDSSAEALKYFTQAAESGYNEFTYRLGQFFEDANRGTYSRDAAFWYGLSARTNYKDSVEKTKLYNSQLSVDDKIWMAQKASIQANIEQKWKRDLVMRLNNEVDEREGK